MVSRLNNEVWIQHLGRKQSTWMPVISLPHPFDSEVSRVCTDRSQNVYPKFKSLKFGCNRNEGDLV